MADMRPRSRQRDILELKLERDRDHLAGALIDELIVGRFSGGVDEEILESELAAVGGCVREAAVVLEPRPVSALEPEAVVEEPLAVAFESRAFAGVSKGDIHLPHLLVNLCVLERERHVTL